MIFKAKQEKATKKKGPFNRKKKIPEYLLPPDKKGKAGKVTRPYSLEEMMFYDDVIYDEW